MFIDGVVDVVHADHTLNVFIIAALGGRILGDFGSAEDTSGHIVVVVVSVGVATETLGDEPARPLRLLKSDDEKLQDHHENYQQS